MSTAFPARGAQAWQDRREADRLSVILPAFLESDGQKYNARLINLAQGGALIEVFAPMTLNSIVALHCGAMVARAAVVWAKDLRVGVKFEAPLTDAEVSEQVFRTALIASRRHLRLQSGGLA